MSRENASGTPPRGRRGRSAGLFAIVALVAPVLTGCHHHVRLGIPDTTHGTQFICTKQEIEKDGKKTKTYVCQQSSVIVPELADRSNTELIVLPRECNGMFNEVLVRNADTGSPEVWVTCAPPNQGVQKMD